VAHQRLVGTRGDEDGSFFGLPMHEQREVMELLNLVDVEDDVENGGLKKKWEKGYRGLTGL